MGKKLMQKRVLCFCLILSFVSCLPLPQNILFPSAVTFAADENNKISLNLKSKDLVKTDNFSLNVYRTTKGQKITFKSSNKKVASVKKLSAKSALITGKKVGNATITVTVKESYKTIATLVCKVTVTPPAISIKFLCSSLCLNVKDKYLLEDELILKPNTTAEIPKYKSSDPDIASINSQGIVTAHSEGEVRIRATIDNGKSDTCRIIVKE